jgi:O-acetyl-ADP-ribose deacetylase (regulator of RNase III)
VLFKVALTMSAVSEVCFCDVMQNDLLPVLIESRLICVLYERSVSALAAITRIRSFPCILTTGHSAHCFSQLETCVRYFLDERAANSPASEAARLRAIPMPADVAQQQTLLHQLLITRPVAADVDQGRDASSLDENVLAATERVLCAQYHVADAATGAVFPTDAAALPTLADAVPTSAYPAAARTCLWRGDITRLRVDAIVNAANAELLGCFQPDHRCIDNVIHSVAGPRLRIACARLRGRPAREGACAVTSGAFGALPCAHVMHVVGPQVQRGARVTAAQRQQLADCYTGALAEAHRLGVKSLAVCCVATGLYGFPAAEAVAIALAACAAHTLDRLVFNVFTAQDHELYQVCSARVRRSRCSLPMCARGCQSRAVLIFRV